MKRNLLLLWAMLLPIMASAYYTRIDGICYKLTGSKAEVARDPNKHYRDIVKIPAAVTYKGVRYRVTSIGEFAFYECDSLKSVVIPNGVTAISNSAFQECSSLTSLSIPNGVTCIGDFAFYGCNCLTSVKIPRSVASIGKSAFDDCSSLKNVTIPNSVRTIGDFAFSGCDSLSSVVIPQSVKQLGNAVFRNCGSLKSVSLPNGVTSIGDYAFRGCTSLTSIKIPGSVTHIGKAAFCQCSTLTSFTIPKGITSIGEGTFSDCYSLESISIPSSVTRFGYEAFYDCDSLKEVHITDLAAWCKISFKYGSSNPLNHAEHLYINGQETKDLIIPEGIDSIGNYAFCGCSCLTSITIPNSVISIGEYAFSGCCLKEVHITDLAKWCKISFEDDSSNPLQYAEHLYINGQDTKDLIIPEDVDNIGNYAFYGCNALISVTISKGVKTIGELAFDGCKALTSVNIPEGVTSIGHMAFYRCKALTSVNIPEGVTSIGGYAFYGCKALTSVNIPESVTNIGNSAFSGCYFKYDSFVNHATITSKNNRGATLYNKETSDGLLIKDGVVIKCRPWATSVTIPESVTSIGYEAFSDCDSLKEVHITDLAAWCKISFKDILSNPLRRAKHFYINGQDIKDLIIPEDVDSIGNYAFYGCDAITSITIPNSVISIGEDAFEYCDSLKEVHITDLAAWCKISFKDNLSNPLGRAKHFYINGQEIKDLIIPEGVDSIGNYAFYGCSGLTSITIPKSVSTIGNDAFESYGLKEVHITDLAAWCKISFKNYSSNPLKRAEHFYINGQETKDLVIPEGVDSIGNYAFAGCICLTSITIPKSVTSIGDHVFQNCSGLTSITIPESVTSIGGGAFSGCSGLTSITIPESVTSIGEGAFSDCSGLTSIIIPENVTNIGRYIFSDCSALASVTIPNSVTSIGYHAFENCSSLTSVTIPQNVVCIGNYAFFGCSSLKDVFCFAIVPPELETNNVDRYELRHDINLFDDDSSITLYVPAESIEDYAHYWPGMLIPWYKIKKIKPIPTPK